MNVQQESQQESQYDSKFREPGTVAEPVTVGKPMHHGNANRRSQIEMERFDGEIKFARLYKNWLLFWPVLKLKSSTGLTDEQKREYDKRADPCFVVTFGTFEVYDFSRDRGRVVSFDNDKLKEAIRASNKQTIKYALQEAERMAFLPVGNVPIHCGAKIRVKRTAESPPEVRKIVRIDVYLEDGSILTELPTATF